ncbi:hypothetical protein ACFFRR_008626 [Megaselia abdita]
MECIQETLDSYYFETSDNTIVHCLMNSYDHEENDNNEVVILEDNAEFPCGISTGCNNQRQHNEPEHILNCIIVKILKEHEESTIHIQQLCSILSKNYTYFENIPRLKLILIIKGSIKTEDFIKHYKIYLKEHNYCSLQNNDEVIVLDSEDEETPTSSKEENGDHSETSKRTRCRGEERMELKKILMCLKKMNLTTFTEHDIIKYFKPNHKIGLNKKLRNRIYHTLSNYKEKHFNRTLDKKWRLIQSSTLLSNSDLKSSKPTYPKNSLVFDIVKSVENLSVFTIDDIMKNIESKYEVGLDVLKNLIYIRLNKYQGLNRILKCLEELQLPTFTLNDIINYFESESEVSKQNLHTKIYQAVHYHKDKFFKQLPDNKWELINLSKDSSVEDEPIKAEKDEKYTKEVNSLFLSIDRAECYEHFVDEDLIEEYFYK